MTLNESFYGYHSGPTKIKKFDITLNLLSHIKDEIKVTFKLETQDDEFTSQVTTIYNNQQEIILQ